MSEAVRTRVMAAVEASGPLQELLGDGSPDSFVAAESVEVVLKALVSDNFAIPADTMPVHRSMSLRRAPTSEPAVPRVEAPDGTGGAEVWLRIGGTDLEFQMQFVPRPPGLLGDLYESLLRDGAGKEAGG